MRTTASPGHLHIPQKQLLSGITFIFIKETHMTY
jgi:hypothetical protein